MWQENLMGCQIVFPSPCETRVFPGTSVRGAEIRGSRGGRFYFLSMSGCSLVCGGQGKPVGGNFNHFKSSAFQQVVDFIFEVADSPFGSRRAVKEILIEYGIEFRE